MADPVTYPHLNKVTLVASHDLGDINTALGDLNTAGYWVHILVFSNDNTVLVATKNDQLIIDLVAPQKAKLVPYDQGDIDADIATEKAIGYVPTGAYVRPDNKLLIMYQQLENIAP